jgi:uncharacterized protein YegL
MAGMTWYSTAALRGFARSVAKMYTVKVEFSTGAPRTDGETVFLPDLKPKTVLEFEASCGIALHEISHCKFNSMTGLVKYMTRHKLVAGLDKNAKPKLLTTGEAILRKEIFNVILDIADETRMERIDPTGYRTYQLFIVSNDMAFKRAFDAGRHKQGAAAPSWQILVAAMRGIRPTTKNKMYEYTSGSQTMLGLYRQWLNELYGDHVTSPREFNLVYRYCKSAATSGRQRVSRPDGKRTTAQWRKLYQTADKLFDLLKHLTPPDKPESGSGVGEGDASGGQGDLGGGLSKERAEEAGGSSSAGKPQPGDTTATESVGKNTEANGGDQEDRNESLNRTPGLQGGYGAGNLKRYEYKPASDFDHTLYKRLRRIFGTIAQELAENEHARSIVGGYASGAVFHTPYRAYTDGRCFGRMTEERDINAAVCLLLDNSASMRGAQLSTASAACKAFAESMAPMADVKCFTFGSNYCEVAIQDLDKIYARGGTNLGRPMRAANEWLAGYDEDVKQFLVVLTDGLPCDPEEVLKQVHKCQRRRGKVVVFTLAIDKDEVQKVFPQCIYGVVDQPIQLIMCLKRLAKMSV